jgi:ferredoxin
MALSETDAGYLVEVGTETGRAISATLPLRQADAATCLAAEREIATAGAGQRRKLPQGDLYDRLFERLEDPRWQDVADRCLACSNCTSVCPTCFCHRHRDEPALGGARSEHSREWDSCFTAGHGHLHGFNVRPETRHRYRQWLTHKLGSWHRQYDRSGCVGCGRCITWCPVGIDLTEEAAALCGDTAEDAGA